MLRTSVTMFLLMVGLAHAQNYYPTPNGSNQSVPALLLECATSITLNGSSVTGATPCGTSANPLVVTGGGGGGGNSAAVAPGTAPTTGSVTAFTNGSGLAALVTPTAGLPVLSLPPTTAPSTSTTAFGAITLSTTSTTLVPAATTRLRWLVQLVSSTSSATATCRDDAGTATSGGAGWTLLAAGAGIGWTYPAAGNQAVNCICSAVNACVMSGDYVQ